MGFMIKQQFEENTVKLNYVEIMNSDSSNIFRCAFQRKTKTKAKLFSGACARKQTLHL